MGLSDRIKELNRFVEKNIETIKVGRSYVCVKSCEELTVGEEVLAIDVAESGFSIVLQVTSGPDKRPVTVPIVIAGLALRQI